MTTELGMKDLISIAPMFFLFLGSLLPITLKVLRKNIEPPSIVPTGLALLGILASLASAGLMISQVQSGVTVFAGALKIDGISVLSMVLIGLIAALTVLFAREHRATSGPHFSEFLFLLMNSAMGMMILACANDLIVVFISIEVLSLSLYLLIALSREEILSKEAAFKYFILGSIASAIFLYGVAMVYGLTGTTDLSAIATVSGDLVSQNPLFIIALGMILVGFAFKAAIVPFHSWTPDVYQGAPTPVTAFMASAVKLVTFVAILRFVKSGNLIADPTGRILEMMQWLAVLTMVVGNIAAIMQTNVKRMLAYSSVAHSGYIFIGVIAACMGEEGWRGDVGVMYYVITYAVTTIGAFGVVCLFEKHEGDIIGIDDLKGLSRKYPFLSLVFTIILLSLAGIPPLVGFFGKLFIFMAAVRQGLIWLAIWGAISSVIGVYYYLRPIVLMYMKDPDVDAIAPKQNLSFKLVVALAALVIVMGLATEPIYDQVRRALVSFIS